MSNIPAKLQDKTYTIGGGDVYIRFEGDEGFEPAIAVITIAVPRPLPWYRRLWILLNTDIFELWRQWRDR